jgi:transcriptional regulator with XRE-family HTH domain
MNTILNAKTKRNLTLLADARERHKHSQETAAGLLEVSQGTFSDWESGTKQPSFAYRERLANYIGIPRKELAAYLDDFFSSKIS